MSASWLEHSRATGAELDSAVERRESFVRVSAAKDAQLEKVGGISHFAAGNVEPKCGETPTFSRDKYRANPNTPRTIRID